MKITIEGTSYEIDIQKAKQLGVCKEINAPITNFQVGDVFERASRFRVLIIQGAYNGVDEEKGFNIAGRDGLEPYSDFSNTGTVSKQEILEYLNARAYKFVKNINESVKSLIQE